MEILTLDNKSSLYKRNHVLSEILLAESEVEHSLGTINLGGGTGGKLKYSAEGGSTFSR